VCPLWAAGSAAEWIFATHSVVVDGRYLLTALNLHGLRRTLLTVCLVAGVVGSSSAASEPFSLAQALDAHASLRLDERDLLVSPRGDYVAWIEDHSLYAAAGPGFEPRQIVPPEENTPLTAAYPSSDGHTLFFARGRIEPAFGPYPAQDHREFWCVDVREGKPQLLAKASEVPSGTPVFAPDGHSFVTAEGPMLYEYRIEESALERRPLLRNDPQHYAAIQLSSLVYSPDGKQLAFVSWRKAKQSYVGLYNFATGDYRYVDPGIFRDLSPVWSPDGREIAFVRMPGNWTRNYRFSPALEGAPWSLLVANAASGAVRTLWQAERGPGSMFYPFGSGSWMEPNRATTQLLWTPSGQILFPWEKTGWLLLYAVSVRGGQATLLTPGEGEITVPTVSADGRYLIYASNIGDIPRLHLWRLSLEGGAPEQLTHGKGVEHSPKFLAGGQYAYIGNVEGRMPNRRLLTLATGRVLSLTPRAEDEARHRQLWQRFVDTEIVPIRAADGVTSYDLLMLPRQPPPKGGFPVIISSKGGPEGRVSPGNAVYTALGQYAASRGYVFVEMNYRGCSGFGLNYRLPPGRGATGGSEVKDLEALANYLTHRPDVNPKRIGIMGGGLMAVTSWGWRSRGCRNTSPRACI
jgi:dipeptidyl aminopeptidase/acylaminoacyl peptidase